MAEAIKISRGKLKVPDVPIIPFIEGDGTGRDIWRASVRVFDAAVERAFGGRKRIEWIEVLAGEKAFNQTGEWLPKKTLSTISKYSVAIKGPLTTPVGGGIRSLNVSLRQIFDLYACVRPVRYFVGVPSPVKEPSKIDIVIYRENTEDVYAGIEFKAGSKESKLVSAFLKKNFGVKLRETTGIGIKPMSKFGSQRLVRRALEFAVAHKKPSVTMMHKGNIMKYTEGAFRDWGYEIAKKEFSKTVISEDEVYSKHDGVPPGGKVVLKDRIADSMFQQILLRPDEYSVVATPNLNGDYFSDAAAAQTGGLGMAPGANIGDKTAIFEATHGTAPKYADKDVINPSSVILSGVMMFEHLGWQEAADGILHALQTAINQKRVTYDLARQMEGAVKVKCSEFADAIIGNLGQREPGVTPARLEQTRLGRN